LNTGVKIVALYLVQHGRNLPEDVDPERGLSDEGIAEVQRIAELAKGYGVHVAGIKHSGKKRARQTAEIFASAFRPVLGVHQRDGLKPMDDVVACAREVDSQSNLMLVGHLPFMSKLAAYLIAGSIDRPVLKFQNGGIVCLEWEAVSRQWVIKWTLMPTID